MSNIGRPTKYNREYHVPQVFKYCLAGLTDTQIANLFEISEATLNNWKNEYPEFLESLKRGKEDADSNVASMLYKKAVGYKEKRQVPIKVRETTNGESSKEKVEIIEVEDYYPPETSAQIFWLKNRNPQMWRDKREVEMEVENKNHFDYSKLSKQTIKELINAEKGLTDAEHSE